MANTPRTVKEIADWLGLAPDTVRDFLRTGVLRGNKTAQGWEVEETSAQAARAALTLLRTVGPAPAPEPPPPANLFRHPCPDCGSPMRIEAGDPEFGERGNFVSCIRCNFACSEAGFAVRVGG